MRRGFAHIASFNVSSAHARTLLCLDDAALTQETGLIRIHLYTFESVKTVSVFNDTHSRGVDDDDDG